MSLQVWLPLNGDLHNQGLSDITIINNGATINSNGKIGKCYSFNGTDSYINISNFNLKNFTNYSICFWVKSIAGSLDSFIQLKDGVSVTFTMSKSSFSYRDSKHSSLNAVSFTPIPENTWIHMTLIYSAGSWKVYENGILDNEFIYSSSAVANPNTIFYIGRRSISSGTTYFNGMINDFRVYNHSLSTKEVEEISKELILHYKLDKINYLSPVPNEYQLLEYLESTGTQYIDTNIVPQTNFKYNFKYSLLAFDAYKGPFSAFNAETANTVRLVPNNGSSSNILLYFENRANAGVIVSGLTTGINQVIEGTLSQKKYYLKNLSTGVIKQATSTTDLFTTKGTNLTATMKLFGGGSTYISKSRIYYFDTLQNNEYIQKLYPVKRKSDGVLGLYDIINNILYTNIGSGTFTAGPEISFNSIVYDSSGYNNNGVIEGNEFESSSDSAKYSHSILLPNNNWIRVINRPTIVCSHDAITVNIWAKIPTSWSYNQGSLISCRESGGWAISRNSSNILYFEIYADGAYRVALAPDSTYLTSILNSWHMFTGTADNSTINFYIDGELVGTKENTATTDFSYYNNYIFIGAEAKANDTTPYSIIDGLFGDTRIYATALTPHQIKELYQTTATIDKNGNIYAKEYIENNANININKNGQLQSNKIVDSNDITIANFKKSDKSINGNTIYEY